MPSFCIGQGGEACAFSRTQDRRRVQHSGDRCVWCASGGIQRTFDRNLLTFEREVANFLRWPAALQHQAIERIPRTLRFWFRTDGSDSEISGSSDEDVEMEPATYEVSLLCTSLKDEYRILTS